MLQLDVVFRYKTPKYLVSKDGICHLSRRKLRYLLLRRKTKICVKIYTD